MDDWKVWPVFVGHELNIPLRNFSGAHAHRAIHTGTMNLEEHTHDWPHLVLHLLGKYREINATGELDICSPAAVFHPAGMAHREEFGPGGAEVLIIKFDPRWLPGDRLLPNRPRSWSAGSAALAARVLSARWLQGLASERELKLETALFFKLAHGTEPRERPNWIHCVDQALERESAGSATKLAKELGLNRAWLARSYRAQTGEGVREAARRKRVERAIALLRHTDNALADVAINAGFCDQSHLNRAVRALTGRTPLEVRGEQD